MEQGFGALGGAGGRLWGAVGPYSWVLVHCMGTWSQVLGCWGTGAVLLSSGGYGAGLWGAGSAARWGAAGAPLQAWWHTVCPWHWQEVQMGFVTWGSAAPTPRFLGLLWHTNPSPVCLSRSDGKPKAPFTSTQTPALSPTPPGTGNYGF